MKHNPRPIERWDPFSEHNEWTCAICSLRLIHLIGFGYEWMHHWRKVE